MSTITKQGVHQWKVNKMQTLLVLLSTAQFTKRYPKIQGVRLRKFHSTLKSTYWGPWSGLHIYISTFYPYTQISTDTIVSYELFLNGTVTLLELYYELFWVKTAPLHDFIPWSQYINPLSIIINAYLRPNDVQIYANVIGRFHLRVVSASPYPNRKKY